MTKKSDTSITVIYHGMYLNVLYHAIRSMTAPVKLIMEIKTDVSYWLVILRGQVYM